VQLSRTNVTFIIHEGLSWMTQKSWSRRVGRGVESLRLTNSPQKAEIEKSQGPCQGLEKRGKKDPALCKGEGWNVNGSQSTHSCTAACLQAGFPGQKLRLEKKTSLLKGSLIQIAKKLPDEWEPADTTVPNVAHDWGLKYGGEKIKALGRPTSTK